MKEKKNSQIKNDGRDDSKKKLSINDPFMIARWISDSLAGELTGEEKQALEDWCVESRRNRRLYDRILDEENQKWKKRQFDSFDKAKGWEGYSKKRIGVERGTRGWGRVARYAAVLLLTLGVAFYFLLMSRPERQLPLLKEYAVVPGGAKAELRLADGQTIDLTGQFGMALEESGAILQNSGSQLSYRDSSGVKAVDSLVYNEVSVPAGGEYQLRLSDGTMVFLNSKTRIRFPVTFSGDRREVELDGEAYFEVTMNKEKPFVVKTISYDVTVLGTRFNVTAYDDESITSTTLVDGVVAVSGKGFPGVRLKPDERFVWNKSTGVAGVKAVDVSYFTAWKDGKFRFRDVRLEDIMRMVERWYDVTVVYDGEEVKDFRFGFNVSRHETIDPLLRVFELNGKVKICREGRVLKIKRGR